jgi:hypothetical protein
LELQLQTAVSGAAQRYSVLPAQLLAVKNLLQPLAKTSDMQRYKYVLQVNKKLRKVCMGADCCLTTAGRMRLSQTCRWPACVSALKNSKRRDKVIAPPASMACRQLCSKLTADQSKAAAFIAASAAPAAAAAAAVALQDLPLIVAAPPCTHASCKFMPSRGLD